MNQAIWIFIALAASVASLESSDGIAESAPGARSDLAADESLLFFPTTGEREPDGRHWRLTISGWVFEPDDNRVFRGGSSKVLEELINAASPEESARLKKRLRLFFVDNERGKSISVRLGKSTYRLPRSGADGRFSGTIRLGAGAVNDLLGSSGEAGRRASPDGRWLSYEAVLPVKDRRIFRGRVQLVEPHGVCVVSDIDDTIKVSQVHSKTLLLKNTFAKKHRPVKGMAALYRRWHREGGGVSFHYLSNSPLPLYETLAQFLANERFPDGVIHLRPFRWRDGTFAKLLTSSTEHKESALAALAQRFPKRRFVLVGDCGEQDPVIYARFARRRPGRVLHIYLRAPRGKATRGRWKETFRGVPGELWSIFRSGGDISAGLDKLDHARAGRGR